MNLRAQFLTVVCLLALATPALADRGAFILEGRGGAMIPIDDFGDEQKTGGAYTVAAGYQFTDFFDLFVEFTHSFNEGEDLTLLVPGASLDVDQSLQTFVVSVGPRINFLPEHYMVRPYMTVQGGWYHFSNFTNVIVDGRTRLSDDDDDAAGIQAGLGINGTILEIFERRGDEVPVFAMTAGIHGLYHHAFSSGDDRQFVTAMGTLGVRF